MESETTRPTLTKDERYRLGSSIRIGLEDVADLIAAAEKLVQRQAESGTPDPELTNAYQSAMKALGLTGPGDVCAKSGDDIIIRAVQSRLPHWERNRTPRPGRWALKSRNGIFVMFLLRRWRNVCCPSADPYAPTVFGYDRQSVERLLLFDCGVKVMRDRSGWIYAVPVEGDQGEGARHWKVYEQHGLLDAEGDALLDDHGNEIGYEIEIPVTEVMPYADAVSRGLIADGDKPAMEFGGAARTVSVQVGAEKRWIGPPKDPSGV